MARANGFRMETKINSLDMSLNNRMLAVGGDKLIKLYTVATSASYWYDLKCSINSRKAVGSKNENVKAVSWNKSEQNRHLLSACPEGTEGSISIIDTSDIQACPIVHTFRLGGEDDVEKTRISEFVWNPNSANLFMTSSPQQLLLHQWDLREPKPVMKMSTNEVTVCTTKFSHTHEFKLATLGGFLGSSNENISTYLTIYDLRMPNNSLLHEQGRYVKNPKEMLFDWQPNGSRIVAACQNYLDVWRTEDGVCRTEVDKFLNIQNLKWLKPRKDKKSRLVDRILISETDSNTIKLYDIKNARNMEEIFIHCTSSPSSLNPSSHSLKPIVRWITDAAEELIFAACYKDVDKGGKKKPKISQPDNNYVFGIYIEEGKNFTKTIKPIAMELHNDLAFCTSKNSQAGRHECLAIFQERGETAVHIAPTAARKKPAEEELENEKIRLKNREEKRRKRMEKRELKRLYENRYEAKEEKSSNEIRQHIARKNSMHRVAKPGSGVGIGKCPSLDKIRRRDNSLDNYDFKSSNSRYRIDSQSSSGASSEQDLNFSVNEWCLDYREELEYFEINYKLGPVEEKWRDLCKHNAHVALKFGKYNCAQFWSYLTSIAFPNREQAATIQTIFEDSAELELQLRENKVVVLCSEISDLSKQIIEVKLQRLIQDLIDDNQLQTAVFAAVMIRKKDPGLLRVEFLERIIEFHRDCLRDHGLIAWSNKLAMKAGLTQMQEVSPSFFKYRMVCGACNSYRSRFLVDCSCELVCCFCSEPLRNKSIIVCKVCGHAGHVKQYKEYFVKQGNTECPIPGCEHRCFKSGKEKVSKWKNCD